MVLRREQVIAFVVDLQVFEALAALERLVRRHDDIVVRAGRALVEVALLAPPGTALCDAPVSADVAHELPAVAGLDVQEGGLHVAPRAEQHPLLNFRRYRLLGLDDLTR